MRLASPGQRQKSTGSWRNTAPLTRSFPRRSRPPSTRSRTRRPSTHWMSPAAPGWSSGTRRAWTKLCRGLKRFSPPAQHPIHKRLTERDLVVVHQMSHARIQPERYGGVHALEDRGAFADAVLGDMPVHVAAAEEDWRACKRAGLVPGRAGWTDQAAAEDHDSAESLRMAYGKFGCQARALGEAE